MSEMTIKASDRTAQSENAILQKTSAVTMHHGHYETQKLMADFRPSVVRHISGELF